MVRRLAATAVGVGLATAALTGLSDDAGWSGGGRTVVTAEMAEAGGVDVAMESLGDPDGAGVTMVLLDKTGEAADACGGAADWPRCALSPPAATCLSPRRTGAAPAD